MHPEITIIVTTRIFHPLLGDIAKEIGRLAGTPAWKTTPLRTTESCYCYTLRCTRKDVADKRLMAARAYARGFEMAANRL